MKRAKNKKQRKDKMMNRYPLLETQMGVLAECLRYPESTQYNIPSITKLPDSVALDQVENAIHTIYKGRKELQLKISMDEEGNPWQYVSLDEGFVVRRLKMEEGKVAEYAKGEFVRPYDLLGGDILFRAVLIETERTNYMLLRGYGYDYMQFLANYGNWSFEYVPCISWGRTGRRSIWHDRVCAR